MTELESEVQGALEAATLTGPDDGVIPRSPSDAVVARRMTGTINTVERFLAELPDYCTIQEVLEALETIKVWRMHQ